MGEVSLPQVTPGTAPGLPTGTLRRNHGCGCARSRLYIYPEPRCSVACHTILSHALAVQLYRNEFKPTQGGVIGITLNGDMAIPYDDSPESERRLLFEICAAYSAIKQTLLPHSTL